MKKILQFCIVVFLCFITVSFSTFAVFAERRVALGDVNNDAFTTSYDALSILRYSVGLEDFTPEQIKIADVDEDGIVSASDALAVLRWSIFGVDGIGDKVTHPSLPKSLL